MKVILTAFVLASTILALAGCASLQSFGENNPATSRLVSDQITLRFIQGADDPVERAEKLQSVVEKLRAKINTDTETTLSSIDRAVRAETNWNDYSLADQQVLQFGLLKARQSLSSLIGDGLISPDERATVGTLLDWVDTAAQRVIARG